MPPIKLPATFIDGSPYKSDATQVLAGYLNARGPICLTPQTFKALLDLAEAGFRLSTWHPRNGQRQPVEVDSVELSSAWHCFQTLKGVVPS
jgi:hypothetical protein